MRATFFATVDHCSIFRVTVWRFGEMLEIFLSAVSILYDLSLKTQWGNEKHQFLPWFKDCSINLFKYKRHTVKDFARYSSTIDLLIDCFTRICLDTYTKNEIKRGIRHWKKALKIRSLSKTRKEYKSRNVWW